MRSADIFLNQHLAGLLVEDDEGFTFTYAASYIGKPHAEPVSLTLPISDNPYKSGVLFPFFDGLIPEGWLLDIVEQNWKLNSKDRMGLLLACCKDCIGNISVVERLEE